MGDFCISFTSSSFLFQSEGGIKSLTTGGERGVEILGLGGVIFAGGVSTPLHAMVIRRLYLEHADDYFFVVALVDNRNKR